MLAAALATAIDGSAGRTASAGVALGTLVGAYALMHALCRPHDVRHFSISGIWFLSYIVTIFLPTLFITELNPRFQSSSFVLAVHLGLICIPIGVGIAFAMTGHSRREQYAFHQRELIGPREHHAFRMAVIATLVLTSFVGIYVATVDSVPLEVALSDGSNANLALLREQSFKLLDSPLKPLFGLMRELFFPMLVMILAGSYMYFRQPRWLVLAIVAFLVAFLNASFSLARLPPFALVVMVLILVRSYPKTRPASRGATVAGLAGALAFPLLVTGITNRAGLGAAFKTVVARIFEGPARALYYYFEVVPGFLDYQGGRALGRIARLAGLEPFDIGNFVSHHISPLSSIRSGSANAAFLGELHVDFGVVGVVVGTILIGCIVGLIEVYLQRSAKTIFLLAAYTYTAYTVMLLDILPAPSALIYSGLPLVIAGVWWARRSRLPKEYGD